MELAKNARTHLTSQKKTNKNDAIADINLLLAHYSIIEKANLNNVTRNLSYFKIIKEVCFFNF